MDQKLFEEIKDLFYEFGKIEPPNMESISVDKLCDEIHIPLVKGASKEVDKIGEEVVEKYGEEKLKDIAKLNFKNTERILHTMIY